MTFHFLRQAGPSMISHDAARGERARLSSMTTVTVHVTFATVTVLSYNLHKAAAHGVDGPARSPEDSTKTVTGWT